ncbi:hybrid sensor histidine kinase/response regulator [Mucilaginibacter sp. SP1R1]|uniref:ATP-binding response regulator n=1 Tax=Mucilaginibacter sp. SP1R1 TaxID=2723091 RepID=UPI00160BF316|nr:ATP-binding protein [Mucilaginibacter sp. SP1R1]MBB6151022.1 signal transduction histidine kinase/CheY-like chemotaxis protein [Mucilaginibacter sp. SP1R1]
MSNVTDKYHKLIKDDSKHLDSLFDMKEVPKRSYQLGISALFTGIGLSIYDSFIGLYVSSFLVACFCFAILMFLLLKYNGIIKNLTISIISLTCSLLIIAAALEGLQSEQFLFFFPILVSVPIIVDLKQTKYRESFIYISIIILSFGICILIGRYVTPLQDFTQSQINRLAFVNRIIAIFSTIVFAVAYIFFEKKYINELMTQSKRVIDTRTQFLATMGHELRTPLNGIIGAINLLKQEHTNAQHDEYLQVLKYCSDHMLQQINNILDFNKIEADKLEIHPVELNLKQLLLNIDTPFIALVKEKGLGLELEVDPRLDEMVFADDLRLVQIFNNLLSNALKFTDRGYIKLKATRKAKSKNSIEISFSIEDTGIGVSDQDQVKIFDSFWQVYDPNTKQLNGTGLGLTICVRLLKLMNSKLTLVSQKGKGSTFSFDLTFKLANAKQKVAEPKTTDDQLSGIRVLLVEDNQINMMVARKCLMGFKASVTGVYNGQEAIDELKNDQAYHVILMDLEMPVMNGYTAIFKVKKSYPEIPVIAFTASLVDQEMLSNLLESGFADCISKPFQPLQLLSIIQKQLLNYPFLAHH